MLWKVRILRPGLTVSLLPLLLLVFAFALSAEQEPPAKTGAGPFDGQHCHSGESLDPPKTGTVRHTHNDFHSGFTRDSEHHKKYEDYFSNYPNDVFFSGDPPISSFRQGWKPPGDQHWHNHGDDDTFWWTPDSDNEDTCYFTPYFLETSYDRQIDENTPAGNSVGQPVQAHDDDGEQATHTLEGSDQNFFAIDAMTGQIETRAPLDYETKSSYSLKVKATDPGGRYARTNVNITVNDVEEGGQVSVSGTLEAGKTVSAKLSDPDGGVSDLAWVWWVAPSADGPWEEIDGATGHQYALTTEAVGKYVRATAKYTDERGPEKSAHSLPLLVRKRTPDPIPAEKKEEATPTPTPTSTPTPTPTAVPLSIARSTSTPTPMSTATPTPTRTPSPTPSPTPTLTPTATSLPESRLANSPPFFVEGNSAERTVPAGAFGSVEVGAPVLAVDPEGDTVTYSRDGTDMGYFVLNTVSGQVLTATTLPAGRSSFALRLWARDGRGGADFIDVLVVAEQEMAETTAIEAPTPVPTPKPTATPTPTAAPALAQTELQVAAPSPDPKNSPTATIDTSNWGPGWKINTPTPAPERAIPVVDIGNQRPPDSDAPVALAQAGAILPESPFWPRLFLWIGGLGLLFALIWILLMALRGRRNRSQKDSVWSRSG